MTSTPGPLTLTSLPWGSETCYACLPCSAVATCRDKMIPWYCRIRAGGYRELEREVAVPIPSQRFVLRQSLFHTLSTADLLDVATFKLRKRELPTDWRVDCTARICSDLSAVGFHQWAANLRMREVAARATFYKPELDLPRRAKCHVPRIPSFFSGP